MNRLKNWLNAFRLRTLPLSMSGIILGSSLAYFDGFHDGLVFILSLSTTLFYQVLSNLANYLGDHYKGADNENRVGPSRSTQSGEISAAAMKKAVLVFSIFSLLSTLALLISASKYFDSEKLLAYIFLGISCVVAAITYTMGKKAYGYLGLGDVFVFIFFGLVAAIGVYNLYTPSFSFRPISGALTIGLLSTAVLNLNNLRDHVNDKEVGKNTLIVKIGFHLGKRYHYCLVCFAVLSTTLLPLQFNSLIIFTLPIFLLVIPHLKKVRHCSEPKDLDSELKKIALITFGWSVVTSCILVFL